MPTIPDFTSLNWQTVHSELEITHRIMDGNEPLMPAYRDKLTTEQNLGLAIYVRAFAIDVGKAVAVKPEVEPPKEPPTAVALRTRPGTTLKNYICMSCHDRDGTGKVVRAAMPHIPNFTDAKWQKEHTEDAALAKSIVEGKGKFMPPMKEKPAKGMWTSWLPSSRSFSDGKTVVDEESKKHRRNRRTSQRSGPPHQTSFQGPHRSFRRGTGRLNPPATVIYREYCVNRHGKDGIGLELETAMPDIPNFTNASWQASRSNPQLSVSILEGKGKLMPPFRDRVKDDQVNALVAYLREFGPERPSPVETTTPSEFEDRFRRLQEEWDALQKQLDELKKPKKE